jgi:hypothetical protein
MAVTRRAGMNLFDLDGHADAVCTVHGLVRTLARVTEH